MRKGKLFFCCEKYYFKDAISVMIAAHQNANPAISPRPAIVKEAEKKTGRKKQQLIVQILTKKT